MSGETKRSGVLARLAANRRGNTAMVFAFSLLPIAMAAGAAVDLRRQATSKGHLQEAADAAVLAAVRSYFRNTRLSDGERLALAEQTAASVIDIHVDDHAKSVLAVSSDFELDLETGEATLRATGKSPAAFGGFFGVRTLPLAVESEGVAGGRPVEITLVLDNTTSMFANGPAGGQRFSVMRNAAMQYVNDVYDLAGERAKVSVVPWTTLVNINSEAVAAPNAAPSSVTPAGVQGSRRAPVSPYANRLNVLAEPADASKALTASRMAELSRPASWRGCIRTADGEVGVGGGGKVNDPISDAAPGGRWPAALLASSHKQSQKRWCARSEWVDRQPSPPQPPGNPSPPKPPPERPPAQGALEPMDGQVVYATWTGGKAGLQNLLWSPDQGLSIQPVVMQRECREERTSTLVNCDSNGSTGWHDGGHLNAYQSSVDAAGQPQACSTTSYWEEPVQTGVNALCVSDPNEINYLRGGGRVCPWQKDAFPGGGPSWTSWKPISGPNLNCPVPILPLSQNRRQVLEKLNEMYPVPGGTLPDVGLLWALRTLSPESYWTSFWGINGDSQKPAPFGSRQADKIVILLTDGRAETPYDFEGYYGCTKKGRNAAGNCWQSKNAKSAFSLMNGYSSARWSQDNLAAGKMTESACKQLREKYKIDVYYILVDVPGEAALEEAQRCAPESGRARSVTSGELGTVFTDLVQRQLRLSK